MLGTCVGKAGHVKNVTSINQYFLSELYHTLPQRSRYCPESCADGMSYSCVEALRFFASAVGKQGSLAEDFRFVEAECQRFQ